MIARILRALPIGLSAVLLGVCALLLMSNLVLANLGRPMKLVPGLAGVMAQPPAVDTSWTGVLHGATQAELARRVAAYMPFYPWAVRLRDQVEYSVFSTTPLPSLTVGRHGILLESAYAVDWCSRDIAAWRPGAVRWAAKIRDMQDETERRGHAFLYVLTPSKVAQYPRYLPPGYTCPSRPADRAGLLPAWRAILHDAGVHVADTAAALSAAHAKYPFPLYPEGGTHWNAVGEAIGQQVVLAALDRLLPGRGFAPGRFTWTMQPHATGNDLDLARLMNLFVPAANGPEPVVSVQPAPPPAPCRPPRVVIVGGSFSHATVEALGSLPCQIPAAEYEYWRAYTLGWDGHSMTISSGVDARTRDADVLGADVLIYEENEQTLSHPYHGQALWAFLQAHPAP